MTHAIYFNRKVKHGDIIDFRYMYRPSQFCKESFKENYHFVWEIYKQVANDHGIWLPYRFIKFEILHNGHRYSTRKYNAAILEPLSRVVHVDNGYGILANLHVDAPRASVSTDYNWYRMAERFFMVHGSAASALRMARHSRQRTGIIAEKFRAIKVRELTSK